MNLMVNGEKSDSSNAMQHQSQAFDHHEPQQEERANSLQLKQNVSTRKNLLFLAKIAERAQRYDDMKYYVREVVLLDTTLNEEEKNMLAVSFKNSLTKRRISWKLIQKLKTARLEGRSEKGNGEMEKDKENKSESESESIEDLGLEHLGDIVKVEIEATCNDLISLMEKYLLPHSASIDDDRGTVFYSKITGDYFRYLTELDPMGVNKENIKKASFYYEKALTLAEIALKPSDPIRLGLVLNMSVFFYEVMKKPDKACLLANRAYDNAISELDLLPTQSQKESSLILELLRNNLELWTAAEN